MASIKKTSIALIIFTILFLVKTNAQSDNFNPAQLAISIHGVIDGYQNKNQALLKLSIANNAKQALPPTGWKMYFNSKSGILVQQADAPFAVQQLKGNLFQLSPTAVFKGLSSKQTINAEIILDGRLLNKNDQPEGFYLVWDNEPTKAINIKNLTTSPVPLQPIDGAIISNFATDTYQKNEAIEKIAPQNLPKIFPTPVSYQENNEPFLLNNTFSINADAAFKNEAALLTDELSAIVGKKSIPNPTSATGSIISLIKKEGIQPEGYELTVNSKAITISASTSEGIFYGIQSLKSLFPVNSLKPSKATKAINIPGVVITDAPRFAYRGFMLDVARNFQTKNEIFKLLDLMALYKLNTFHFHLTEDEGWRLEIDGLPELTQIGARRGHSLDEKSNMPAAYGSGGVTDSLYGSGYYTKADFIGILKYATARHIKVIPEIETPGHARAAIKSMDARYERLMKEGKRAEALQYFLRDTLDKSTYITAQNYVDNVMDVAIPSTYAFVEKVVTEVVKLYKEANAPLTTIHLGGDEVPAGVWEQSPDCIALIKKSPPIKNTDGLWYYYLGKVNEILKAKGLSLSGWEEISFRRTVLDGKKINIPNPDFGNQDFKLYVWNNLEGNEDLAYRCANAGYKTIITFVTNFYFDMAQYKTYDEPGYYWGGYTSLEKAYRFIPLDYLKNATTTEGKPVDASFYAGKQRLTEYGKENIIGIQGALWSETLKGPQQMEYMLLPRLTALAEKAWAKDADWSAETDTAKSNALYNKAWSTYNQQMGQRILPMLDTYAGGFNYRIPFAGAMVQNGKVYANVQFPNLTIRYTTNGTEPTIKSGIYTEPISQKGIIKLKVFNATGRPGNTTVIENK